MVFNKILIQRSIESPGSEGDPAFEKEEKEKRAAELVLANIELAYQNEQKEKRAQELIVANKELAYQNEQKEKRAEELIIANKELAYQNEQKEQRAQELIIANKELAFQNEQKEKRAQELAVANKELDYQNKQKEQRAAELVIANTELAYQNEQKEQRAQELAIANKELAFQNEQKEKRAQELAIANEELAYQNEQKEKRAQELADAIKDLEAFAHVSSHHLQEPLRKIQSFVDRVLEREATNLSEKGRYDLGRIDTATARMSLLIQNIYTYSRINATNPVFEKVNVGSLIANVKRELQPGVDKKRGMIEIDINAEAYIVPLQFGQAMHQLIDNALKFSNPWVPPHITITGKIATGKDLDSAMLMADMRYCYIEVRDNGIGFHSQYNERIFEMFQKLHTVEEYPGTGIGLTIVKKIMDRHKGHITAISEPGKGATFCLYFPTEI
jgi:signal transduction histidine kinase